MTKNRLQEPQEIIHYRIGGLLVDFSLACGAENGLHSKFLYKVTCVECQQNVRESIKTFP